MHKNTYRIKQTYEIENNRFPAILKEILLEVWSLGGRTTTALHLV
jgi:hypothetical protein